MTKKEIADIKKLAQKKHRIEQGLFVVEGIKAIKEIFDAGLKVVMLYCSCKEDSFKDCTFISKSEMERISFLQTPTDYLAIVEMPSSSRKIEIEENNLTLALDGIQDPGNLGTIIRLADWFGVRNIICSMQTADCYNPKVVQATMGAIARVSISYCDLPAVLADAHQKSIPIFGTFMSGENIYTSELSSNGVLVMGNEGSGITPQIESLITKKLTIPAFKSENVESLNVAIATAICCSEFKRRIF